ncbi:MAG: transglycosylase domain-containing protein [Bacteriovoracaceae bacterium]|nr:transglycosylase domain-containing protein [Bacteriovoracaceae bacterium]
MITINWQTTLTKMMRKFLQDKNKFLVSVALIVILAMGLVLAQLIYMIFHVESVMSLHSAQEQQQTMKSKDLIESESLVRVNDLNYFLLFLDSSQAPIKNPLQEALGEIATVSEDLPLPPLLKNDCEELYCFQYKAGFEKIPSSLWRGLIGIEDVRFLEHQGIDFKSIFRALWIDLTQLKMAQGGSTITQQLSKNLFFSNERSIIRKIKEAVYSLYIETKFSKEQIINAYLNEVFWGSLQGVQIKGFYAAALAYFSKLPEDLSDYEVSILISMLKGPYYYSPLLHPDRLRERANLVYKILGDLELLVYAENGVWSDKDWSRWLKQLERQNNRKNFRAIWRTTRSESSLLSSYEEYIFHLSVFEALRNVSTQIKDKDIAIKAMINQVSCPGNCEPAFGYYSKIERNKEKALDGEFHQVGSVLKPIFYQILLNNGKKIDEEVSTSPITLQLKSGEWTPKESHPPEAESVTVLRALQDSKNIPLIRLAQSVGFDKIENEALLYLPELKTPLSEYPSQMLGSVEMSVKSVSDTYQQYIQNECSKISDGEYDFEDGILYQLSRHGETTISKAISERLKDVPFFGKTGTTNSGLDNWYVAYDGHWNYVFWLGLEGNRIDQKLALSGAWTSFQIFQNFYLFRGKRFVDLACPVEL